jgi:phytoene desaturase
VSSLEYNADVDAVSAAIARISPADADGYRRFLAFSEEVFREGYLKLGTVPFQDIWSMLRVAPQLIRLKSHRSVHSVVSDYMRDPHLRQAFSFHSLLIGGNPFHVPSIYALIHALERRWGVFFPRGGTGALVAALARLFQDLGGEIRLNCPVEGIQVSHGVVTGVALSGGSSLMADAVASNADVVHTYAQPAGGHRSWSCHGRPAEAWPLQQFTVCRALRPEAAVSAAGPPHGAVRSALSRIAGGYLRARRAGR